MAAVSLGAVLLPFPSLLSRGDSKKSALLPPAPLSPFYLPPSDAPLEGGPVGLNIRTLIRSAQTNGQFSCVETYIAPMQMGPAPHVHKKLDELMYVTEGTVSWMIGDKVYEVMAGGWIFRPHGITHTFWNATGKPARAVDMFFHQNLEDYLETLFFQIFADMIKNHLKPDDPDISRRMEALNRAFGIRMFPERRQVIADRYGLHA